MSQPLWATQERQSQLVKFAMKYKGVCLEGHARLDMQLVAFKHKAVGIDL